MPASTDETAMVVLKKKVRLGAAGVVTDEHSRTAVVTPHQNPAQLSFLLSAVDTVGQSESHNVITNHFFPLFQPAPPSLHLDVVFYSRLQPLRKGCSCVLLSLCSLLTRPPFPPGGGHGDGGLAHQSYASLIVAPMWVGAGK